MLEIINLLSVEVRQRNSLSMGKKKKVQALNNNTVAMKTSSSVRLPTLLKAKERGKSIEGSAQEGDL